MNSLFSYLSDEIRSKIALYLELLEKWNKSVNLVDKKTMSDSLERHIVDSLQLFPLINSDQDLLDVGSGAGFPGMVLAIAGCKKVTLVESDRKKCLFLEEVARVTKNPVVIINDRVERLAGCYPQLTARAFNHLSALFEILKNVSRETKGVGYFLKGESWQQEIEETKQKGWRFDFEVISSVTNTQSRIIKAWDLKL